MQGRYTSLVGIVGATALALAVPQLGPLLEPLTAPIVAALVFASIRDFELDSLRSDARPLAAAFGLTYLVVPALALAFGTLLLDPEPLTGVLVMVAAPSTAGSAIVWTRLAGGKASLAAIIAVVTIALSPVVTPAVLSVVASFSIELSATAILVDLLTIVGGGVALAVVLPDDVPSDRTVRSGSLVAIALLVYVSVATADPAGSDLATVLPVAVVVAGVVAAVFAGLLLAGRVVALDRRVVPALLFSATLRNLGVGLLLAAYVPLSGTVVAVVTYYVVQQLAGAFFAGVVFDGRAAHRQSADALP